MKQLLICLKGENIFVQIMLKYTGLKEDEEEVGDEADTIMEEDYEYMEIEETDEDYETEEIVKLVEIKKVKEVAKENKQKINYEMKNNNTSSAGQSKKMLVCRHCKFKCRYKSNFIIHLNSIKHKEQNQSKNICKWCFKEFANASNRIRHERNCPKLIK